MKRSRPALLVSGLLFVSWLVYLAVHAWEYRQPPIIVSRAQLLASQYDVLVTLNAANDGRISGAGLTVSEILYAADKDGPTAGQNIDIVNLNDCQGFVGPGSYVAPLARSGKSFRVAAPPLDPGAYRSFPPTIYPLNEQVRRQFASIRAGGEE